MGIYTKTGDHGTTGLFTGERVDKDSIRVEAYGSVDEANSFLGLARAFAKKEEVIEQIHSIQKISMLLMAELASKSSKEYITQKHIDEIENIIDNFEGKLPPLTAFITPGDTSAGAALDVARTTIRRAERRVLALHHHEAVSKYVTIYLNRLSDLCFVLMRYEEL